MFDTHVDVMPLVIALITSVGIPLATFFLHLAVGRVCALLAPYIGDHQALALQHRANELLDKGIGEAVLHYLPELQARGLTVDVGNVIAARVASYATNHSADLATRMEAFEGSLEEKVKARLIVHPAVQAALALPAPVELHPAAAAA